MFTRIAAVLANAFPLWVLLAGGLALVEPRLFTWFTREFIEIGLAVIMLGMGITLSVDDFKAVLKSPWGIGVGFVAQYTIMPFMGWLVAYTFNIRPEFAAGIILVACCPGGTASNVVTYLARANVPLSVLMTMCSTFAAVIMTPLLTQWLAGRLVNVDTIEMIWSTAKIVLIPLIAGLALHHFLPRLTKFVMPVGPLVSVITIALICGSIIGTSANAVREAGWVLVAAVLTVHAGGFLLGYIMAWVLRFKEDSCRTISIEVGMQNSGLGAALAKRHFADPVTGVALAAVPCAISAIIHSVIGSILAGIWRLWPPKDAN